MLTAPWMSVLLFAAYINNASTNLFTTVMPQRAGVTYLNSKYIESGTINVKRFGRRSAYTFNIFANIKYNFENNITAHLIFNEFLHNEYKRSFVEMHFKLCDMIHKDPLVGKAIAQTGIVCPILAGNISITNITIPAENFPNVWPFENNKVEITLQQTPSQDIVARFYLIIIVKQKRSPKNSFKPITK